MKRSGESATITFDMDELEALVEICARAAGCGGEGFLPELFGAAFTAATLIARTHGDISDETRAHMAKVHASLKGAS